MDVGATLREARLRCAMSLEDVEKLTKIRVDLLHAIEANQKDRLPHAMYVRGFVRAFAREVGLDPDDIAKQYVEQHEPVADVIQPLVQQNDVQDDRWDVLNSWFVLVMLLTVGFGGYKVVRWHEGSRRTEPAVAPSTSTSPTPAPTRPETGTTGAAMPTPSPAAVDTRTMHIEVRATGSCWLTATVDGARALSQMMEKDERHTLDAQREAVLRVGDPSTFEFSINGQSGRSLGRANEAITVRLTSDNYRDFLSR